MLDNSVAGGIAGGTSALDTLVKEAAEEASLDPELVRKRARSVGPVSYYRQTNAGWLQPEVQYVYDLRSHFQLLMRACVEPPLPVPACACYPPLCRCSTLYNNSICAR
ncbi:hypothetical protein BJV74DRAFT_861810 [Russula compacta]|nr:hypothetical protein BJV74DRAFT_861810 [Russula compacta]